MILHLDIETRSRCDIKLGAFRYANDLSTETLCLAVALEDEQPELWVPSDKGKSTKANSLLALMNSPDSVVYSHNALFEIANLDRRFVKETGFLPPRHEQWRCTMAMARRAGLPASLGKCADALGLTQQKDTKGAALIRKFSIPQKKTGEFIQPDEDPDAFKEFCDYCRQDVRVEQEIHKKLKAFELKGFSLATYQLDMDINTRGIPVNLAALHNADRIIDEESEYLAAEFQKITGLMPTQNVKVLEWVKANGYDGANLQAETLDEALEELSTDPDSLLGRALSLKKQISYASLKKVKSMIACAGPHDNRVRGSLNYYGAGTGRWSASLIQPQNFKKPSRHLEKVTEAIYKDVIEGATPAYLSLVYGPPLECISSAIRHFIHDTKGSFLDADYSAIEARIIAWQAQEEWRLEVFRTHGKIYEASASQMFNVPLSEFSEHLLLEGTHHPLRKKGKVAELALGYQGGVNAMIKMGAEKEGLTKPELMPIVKAWRESSPNIVQLWYDAENAAKSAVKRPGESNAFGVGCEMFCAKTAGTNYLFMRLPSGRRIAYPHPAIEKQLRWATVNKVTGEEVSHSITNPSPEDLRRARDKDPKARIGDALTYWGQIPMKAVWGRVSLYGGKLVENLVQGIAADVMAVGATNAKEAGYEICMLVHDQAIAHHLPGQTIEEFIQLLTTMPVWAEGLPLAAAGGVVPFYRKD